MFETKLKGDTKTYPSSFVELRIDGVKRYVETEATLINVINKYEVEELEVMIKGKYYPLYNCYYKSQQMLWLLEGIEW